MKCVICGYSVELGPLLRVNAKGQPGIFAHEQCKANDQPEEVKEIVDLIHKENTKPIIH